jgi:Lrp/AsnC family transcriptional regulator for asnA, asnC and gidA
MDGVDRKILYHLDVNSRCPVKKIASLIGEKSEKINYRLKRLVNDGVIRRFHAEIDPWKTGYSSFKVCFQFQGVDKEKIDEMYEFLLANCNVGWVATCLGRWDMIVEIMARNRYEFIKFYSLFHKKYYEYILYKVVSVTLERIFINKKWLAPELLQTSISYMSGTPDKVADEKDFSIMRHLISNGRDSVKKISSALSMPPTTISQRISNLMKKEVILNFRIDLDLKKFKKVFCKSFIYFSGASTEDQKLLFDYCITQPDVVFLTKCIAPWDMEIEGHCDSFNDFTQMMSDLKNRYPGVIRNFESVVINQETGSSHIPKDNPDKK